MSTYQQINGGHGHGCTAGALMVAEDERSNGGGLILTNQEEINVHTQIAFRNWNLPAVYNANVDSSPVSAAHYATATYGFNHAEIILSGQIFPRMLTHRFPQELPRAQNLNIPVHRWIGWSPRFLYTWRWVLMVVLCVDHTPASLPRVGGGALGGITGGLALGTSLATLGGTLAGVSALTSALWLYDLARGLGIGGHPNLSLHTVLYRGGTYMDPADGREYWFLGRMGGPGRAYWDAGCYVVLS